MTISILQVNICSISSSRNYLEAYLKINNIDVAILSETWLKRNRTFRISGYSIVRADREDGYGGSCILIKNKLYFSELKISDNFNNHSTQISGISLNIRNIELQILSIYCSPKHKISSNFWVSLMRSVKQPVLICGDLNAHHRSYGCAFDDYEGRQLIDAINSENLCVMNDGSPTLFSRLDCRPSAIDVSLCSPSLLARCEWKIITEPLGSDHLGIHIDIDKNRFQAPTNTNSQF